MLGKTTLLALVISNALSATSILLVGQPKDVQPRLYAAVCSGGAPGVVLRP